MPTQVYKNKAGEIIPGNTTVIGQNLGWSKGALMYWAWKQGKDGKDFRETRDAAADIGTVAHAMVECDIKGREFDPKPFSPELLEKAGQAFQNYRKWKAGVNFKLVDMEVPCVSEVYEVGTTVDIVAKVDGELALVEVKTSNAVHEDYLIQMACQGQCWLETKGIANKIREYHLLRLGKEEATFTHHYWGEIPHGLEAFAALRELHALHKGLKKLL